MTFKYEIIEPKLFAGAAADEVVASVLDFLAEKERCSIALAGGSTPVSVYRALTVSPRVEDLPWGKLDLLFGDERWVPHTDTQSNLRMVSENLLARLSGEKPRVFSVNTALPTAKQGAEEYEKTVTKLLIENNSASGHSSAVPEIDLVLLGMGEDGHTASIFPDSTLMTQRMENQSLTSVENWPNLPGAFRVTMTPKLLCSAKKIIFLVNGSAKAEMVARAFDDRDAATLPVHLFRAVEDKVTWLLDSASAKLLRPQTPRPT